MSDKAQTQSGGVGFLGLLTVLFVGLKLTGHVDWPWWKVFAPMWLGVALFVAMMLVFLAVSLAVSVWGSRR